MSVSELCREFGVSRPTGYRWINRYKESGPEGLLNLTSKPRSCSHATPETIENAILALRGKYPSWGARKLKARLEQLDSSVEWPVASTFGNILQRAGLTSPKRKKRRTTPYSEPFSEVTAPNQLWCMDFKGYFATGDGSRCDPFTITDAHSILWRVKRHRRSSEWATNGTFIPLINSGKIAEVYQRRQLSLKADVMIDRAFAQM